MFTISFLLAIALLLSLWLILRARAASFQRKVTAQSTTQFTIQMLAQFEQMEAALSASDREFESLMREQRKLERSLKPKEQSTATKRSAKLQAKLEVKPRSPRQKCKQTISTSALPTPPCETLPPPITPSVTSTFLQQWARALTNSVRLLYRPIYVFSRAFSSFFTRPKPPLPPPASLKQSSAA